MIYRLITLTIFPVCNTSANQQILLFLVILIFCISSGEVHILDPEGNNIELWEPNDIEYEKLGKEMGSETTK